MIIDAVNDTVWGDIDYMVADAPAGTSADKFLAIKDALKDSLIGCIITTQPNIIDDVHRLVDLCARHHIRIIGVIENMSGVTCSKGHVVTCPDCGELVEPFGSGGGKVVADSYGLNFFGKIPSSTSIRNSLKNGTTPHKDVHKSILRAVKTITNTQPPRRGLIEKIVETIKW